MESKKRRKSSRSFENARWKIHKPKYRTRLAQTNERSFIHLTISRMALKWFVKFISRIWAAMSIPFPPSPSPSNKYSKCLLEQASILLSRGRNCQKNFDVTSSGKEIFASLAFGSSKYFAFLDVRELPLWRWFFLTFFFSSLPNVKIAAGRKKSVRKILISAFLAFHNH